MAKDNKMLYIGLGIVAVLFLGKKGSGSASNCANNGNKYTLPNGSKVCESQLPGLGYVQYQGQWYPASAFQPTGQYANVSPTSPQWLNILNQLIATGTSLAPYITTLVQSGQNSGGLSSGGTGGGDGALGKVGTIQKYPNSQTKRVCNNGNYSTSTNGACAYNGGVKHHYNHNQNQQKRY